MLKRGCGVCLLIEHGFAHDEVVQDFFHQPTKTIIFRDRRHHGDHEFNSELMRSVIAYVLRLKFVWSNLQACESWFRFLVSRLPCRILVSLTAQTALMPRSCRNFPLRCWKRGRKKKAKSCSGCRLTKPISDTALIAGPLVDFPNSPDE